MHGPRKYRRGSRPIRHKFFQSSTQFTVLFKENYTFPRLQRGSKLFRGGGGQTLTRGGGGGSKYKSIRIHITCDFPGVGRTPFPPLDPRMKTHSSDVLLMVWRCACHVLWTLSSNYFLCHFLMNLWSNCRLLFAFYIRFWCAPNLVPSLGRWQLLGSLSFVLQWRDVIYILNDTMDCKNNNYELTASGS